MGQVQYFTLAAVRLQNPEEFDAAIKIAFAQAVEDVGVETAIQALCGVDVLTTKVQKVA